MAPLPELLTSHDVASLAERLERAGGLRSAARAAASRAIALAFAEERAARPGPILWTDEALATREIGAWARPSLLALEATPSLTVASEARSADDTIRLALRARDGELVETVIIPGPARTTVCISSQVGCARACSFCETGRLGLNRQLVAGEIVDQVRVARARWAAVSTGSPVGAPPAPPISNLVFMGMGEPFDNLGEVARAVRLLTDPRALRFAPKHVTVSTVGVVERLDAFFATCPAELAVSLNAPDDERRSTIMPVNRRTPLDVLLAALRDKLPRGRRVLFEYVLFDRFNDATEDADLVASIVAPIRCRVNVIPANPGPDPALRPPEPERVEAFVARLVTRGVTTLVRRPRGRDVGGACGQLAGSLRVSPPGIPHARCAGP